MTKRPAKNLRNLPEDNVDDSRYAADEPITSLPPVREKKRRPIFLLTVLGVLGLLVVLAPSIISLTPLGPNMVASAAKNQIAGTLEVKGVSFGWISPIRLSGISLKDQNGQPLGVVKAITINKSILGLLSSATNLDTITIDEPQFQLVMRPDGSNLEDLLAPMLKQPASKGGEIPEFTLNIRNAMLELVDAAGQKTWQFTPITVQLASPKTNAKFWDVHAEGKLQNAGLFADIKHSVDTAATTPTIIDFRSDQFPLEALQSVMVRALGPTQISGLLSGKLLCEIDGNSQPKNLQFENVEARNFQFASQRLLGADGIQIQQCKANGSAQFAGGVWQLKNLQLESDVAALAGTGDIRISDFTSGNALPQTDCNVQGVIDLARLTKMLPNTLRVREGVEITSGRANVSLVSHAAGAGRRFEASLSTDNLQAKNNGQLVELKEPVAMGAVITQTNQGWRIDRLDAKSSFLTADVTGTTENGQLTLRGDLQRLKDEFTQFFDLSHMKLAGAVDGELKWEANTSRQLATQGSLRFTRLTIEMPGMLPWNEDDLQINFQGDGIQSRGNSYRVGTGKIDVASEKDHLIVTLRQPVESISIDTPLPADVKLTGNLASWLPRVQAFVPLAGWQVSGPIDFQAQANVSAGRVEMPLAKFKIQQFRMEGNGLHINEPVVQGETHFAWDSTTDSAMIANTTIQSTTLAIASEKLEVQTGAAAKITGEAALRGDLGKVLAWLNDPAVPVQNQCFGEMEAELKFTQEGSVTRAQLAGHVANLALAKRAALPVGNRLASTTSPWQTVWTEPDVSFGGEASYDAARDTVTLNKMQTKAGTSLITSSGTLAQLTKTCVADLTGEVRYDLAALSPLARPYLGDTFNIVGVAAKPFELHGPLLATLAESKSSGAAMFPASLTGKAGLNWDSAEWMALQMGGGELSAELKNSTIFVQPTKIPLSQGTVNLSPTLVLGGPQWYVSQEQTKLIDHVVITPEMCNTWIKFVAPLIADATQAQGQFSIDLEKAMVPVNRPTACDMKGMFTVHNVTVGPGPLAQQVIGVAQQVRSFMDGKTGLDAFSNFASGFMGNAAGTPPAAPVAAATAEAPAKQWLELPEQNVPVDVAEGRVHHQGLTMQVKDIVIRTSGSVGIADQSLSLVAEIPILDDWIKNRRELSGLKGQTIQIPIGGTVTRPQLDTRGLVSFGKNLAFTAGRGAIEGELTRSFEKGTGAVQTEVGKVQSKITEQMSNGKAKIESELRDGLKNIFGS